jgi:hypothetical protein
MAVTLAQAMVNAATDVDYAVIDDMRRYDGLLIDNFTWDDVVNPTGGSSLVYGYTRLVTPASAMTRAINAEFIPQKATRTQVTVGLKQWGTAFELDRVLANLGQAATNELQFQLQQATISTRMKFNEMVIRGDTAVDANGFDGLSKLLTGSTTEVNTTTLDITAATITTQALAIAALDRLDAWLVNIFASRMGSGQGTMAGAVPPGRRMLLMNTTTLLRLQSIIRLAGMYTISRDNFDQEVPTYKGWLLVNLGDLNDGTGPIIPIGASVAGETEIYAVSLGLDALHGASVAGKPLLQTFLPRFDLPGAVKFGELEMGPGALVLKSTKSAGVFRKVKVQ